MRRFLAGAGVIVLIALLLRLYRIGAQELWLDEVFSFHMVSMPNWFGAALSENNTPPLYYILLRGWTKFAGHSELSLRLLSALFGTLFVAAVIWTGREIFDSRVGLWSGAFSAIAPMHIYYSQEARTYALMTLALVLTYGTLWRALGRNTWQSWGLFSVCSLLALYSHYFAILGLAPTVVLPLLWPAGEQAKRKWLGYGIASFLSGLLFLPWVFWSFLFTQHSLGGVGWIKDAWERTPPLLAIPKSLEVLGLGSQAGLLPIFLKQFGRLEFPISLRLAGINLLLLLGIWVAIPRGDAELGIPGLGMRKIFLAVLFLFPLLALWLISFQKPVYVAGRYDVIALAPLSLLWGLALAKIQGLRKFGTVLAFVIAAVWLVLIGAKLFLYYRIPPRGIQRAAAQALHASVGNGDLVVFTDNRGLILHYYLSRLGYRREEGSCRNDLLDRRFSCRIVPRRIEDRFSPVRARRRTAPERSGQNVRNDIEELVQALPKSGKVWVVFGSSAISRGRIVLASQVDRILLAELARLGLRPVPVNAALGIVRLES